MATKWQRIRIQLPTSLSPAEQAEAGDLIVERIVERTDQGKDKDGNRFAAYSTSYKESLDFKNAGKSGSKVDLQLSGDMLAALRVLKSTRNWIEVGFDRGTEENAKADGNIRGTYGKPTTIKGKARDFLGISETELNKIIKYVVKQRGD
jgi:hypothetical protein